MAKKGCTDAITVSLHPTRRDFLKLGAALAAATAATGCEAALAAGLEALAAGRMRVVWMQGLACSGCSVSLLNADRPAVDEALRRQIDLLFHPVLSAAQGERAVDAIERAGRGPEPFVLVVEGAVPAGLPAACRLAGQALAQRLAPLAAKAQAVVAVGTCASYGGVPAAEGNPTGAVAVREFLAAAGVPHEGRLVHCPGCPAHPDETLAVLAHLAVKGMPEVRRGSLTPTLFAAPCLHDACPRVSSFTMRLFAMQFGDGDGCLYQLGCRGLDVQSDCARRQWNGATNWCIQASAPCLGCNRPEFARGKLAPFYPKT